jgi:hypothetical protein
MVLQSVTGIATTGLADDHNETRVRRELRATTSRPTIRLTESPDDPLTETGLQGRRATRFARWSTAEECHGGDEQPPVLLGR